MMSLTACIAARLLHQAEGAVPASFREQMCHNVSKPKEFTTVSSRGRVAVFRAADGPVNDQGAAHDVGPGHEPPIAAVQAFVAVVAQHEILSRGNHQVAAMD